MRPRHLLLMCVTFAMMFVQAACSSPAGGPVIAQAWARPGAAGAETAAYLTITGAAGEADALLSASTAGAEMVELHETSMDAEGMMGMHPIERLDIAAGETVRLEPGGFHLMVMGLKTDLSVGDTLELDLVFENAGKVVVTADVKQG